MPFLSIIIPVFNKVKYLDACLKSILNQSFSDFELILVNDGSTDGSQDKCDQYLSADKRIVVVHQQNQGVSAARNNGLSRATGQYIGFIDADDTIANDMFQILVDNARKENADISICSIRITDDEDAPSLRPDEVPVSVLSKDETISAMLKGTLNWSANNKIYKSAIATGVKFEGRMNEDLLYCVRVIDLMQGKAIFQDIEKYNYIKRESSVSLSKFDERQMESVQVSGKIVKLIQNTYPSHLQEAEMLDFVSNLSILNLIILSGETNSDAFKIINSNLKGYQKFTQKTPGLSTKQQYALKLILLSPQLYSYLLKTYCRIFPSEAGKKVL